MNDSSIVTIPDRRVYYRCHNDKEDMLGSQSCSHTNTDQVVLVNTCLTGVITLLLTFNVSISSTMSSSIPYSNGNHRLIQINIT